MNEKNKELAWKVKLFFTCLSYDIRSAALCLKIGIMRMKVALAKRAVEVLKDEL